MQCLYCVFDIIQNLRLINCQTSLKTATTDGNDGRTEKYMTQVIMYTKHTTVC